MVQIDTSGFSRQVESLREAIFQGDSNSNKLVIISSAVAAIGVLAGLYLRKQDAEVDECSTVTHAAEGDLDSKKGILEWVEKIRPKEGTRGILWEAIKRVQEEGKDPFFTELSGALERRGEVSGRSTPVEHDRRSVASSAPGTPEGAYAIMDSFQGHVEPEPLNEDVVSNLE